METGVRAWLTPRDVEGEGGAEAEEATVDVVREVGTTAEDGVEDGLAVERLEVEPSTVTKEGEVEEPRCEIDTVEVWMLGGASLGVTGVDAASDLIEETSSAIVEATVVSAVGGNPSGKGGKGIGTAAGSDVGVDGLGPNVRQVSEPCIPPLEPKGPGRNIEECLSCDPSMGRALRVEIRIVDPR